MNPIEIVRKDSQATVGWSCGKCGLMYTDLMFAGAKDAGIEAAKRCCVEPFCEKHQQPYRYWCESCRLEKKGEELHERFEAATKVELKDYKGEYLYFDSISQDEGYVPVEDVEDVLLCHDGERPTYAWACAPEKVSWDLVEELSSHIHDNHYEDAFENVDFPKLKEAQKLIDEACSGITSYHMDYSTAVLIPPAEDEEEDDGHQAPADTG